MRLPNGYGSVHKISGNRRRPYRVRITVDWSDENLNKKQIYKIIGYYETKEQGLIALAAYNKNPCMIDNDITFNELYLKWSEEHYKKIVPSSKRIWIAAYKHSEELYDKIFNRIKVADLEGCINNATCGNATKIRMKCLYNMMYRYAIKHEITDKNYAIYCDTPRAETIINRVPFSDEEIKILWDNLNMPYVDMILINIYTGLRPRELVELENEKISFNENTLQGGLKTDAGRNRKIPIHSLICPLIKNRYDEKNQYLFVKADGSPMNYYDYRNRFNKIMELLNMTHRPHDARHTFITKAKYYNVNEYILKIIVGHKIADITEDIYTHRSQREINAEIEKIKM